MQHIRGTITYPDDKPDRIKKRESWNEAALLAGFVRTAQVLCMLTFYIRGVSSNGTESRVKILSGGFATLK